MTPNSMKLDFAGPRWLQAIVGLCLVVVIFIFLHGLTLGVTYRWALVHSVQQVPGGDVWERAAVIDTPERRRLVRTGDRLLRVQAGDYVCASRRKLLSRRWLRYGLALPGYCRNQQRPDFAQGNLRVAPQRSTFPQNSRDDPGGIVYPDTLRLP